MNTPKKIFSKIKGAMKKIFIFPMSARNQFRRLMIAVLLAFVVVITLHIRFFSQILSQNYFVASAPTETPSQTVNEKKLTAVLARFDQKAKTRDAVPTLVPRVVEPSK